MGKQFNEQDLRKSVVIHPDLGLGMDAVDTEKRTKSPSLLKKVIQKETALENLGEELRILYVAMTRAKEKLILTGMVSRGTVVLPEEEEEQENGAPKPLSFLQLAGARTCLDWLLAAARGFPGNAGSGMAGGTAGTGGGRGCPGRNRRAGKGLVSEGNSEPGEPAGRKGRRICKAAGGTAFLALSI